MKIVNIMNFVRRIDERFENSTENLLAFTTEQLRLVNEYDVDNTFLLQYDVLCDENFLRLFKQETTEKTELGLWYEIVEPLTSACSIPYRSDEGWKWDWHIIPGYSMAYKPHERELLIDEAMRKFFEVFGYYPKTVAGWVVDTHTINYLAKNYDVSAVAICRDQVNTDAYTLLGGYFNQAYYPSVNNIFTPAQSKECQTNIPVFRLLGSCPIHNYDNKKYCSEEFKSLRRKTVCFTLEPITFMGSTESTIRWMFDTYYGQESLGFAYAQIGQENSFFKSKEQLFRGLRMQIEMLINRGDVSFKKMGETGEWFKRTYPDTTPATAVTALDNFDSVDIQSVYYDCKNYMANLFRFEDKLFFRSLFLFDERVPDLYLEDTCTTFDAVYENLPIVDTMTCPEEKKKQCGLTVDENAVPFTVHKVSDGVLEVSFGQKSVTFFEDRIEINTDRLIWNKDSTRADVLSDEKGLLFEYKGSAYRLDVDGVTTENSDGNIIFEATGKTITLFPKKQ
ncbi:MAG: hypothetical protein IJB86_10905 [Clostridia bacterium]|nr:hypothetical protein [Clostridia bacterium]